MVTKKALEIKIEDLEAEIKSIKMDASIIIKENLELIKLCKENIKDFNEGDYFSYDFRER